MSPAPERLRTLALAAAGFCLAFALSFAATPLVPPKEQVWTRYDAERRVTCPVPGLSRPVTLARVALEAQRARLAVVTEDFTEVVGEPVEPPQGWEAGSESAALAELAAELQPQNSVVVDCTLYPCTVVVASVEDGRGALRSRSDYERWFDEHGYPHVVGIGGSATGLADGTSTMLRAFAVYPEPPDSPARRWARSVGLRATMLHREALRQQ